MEHLIGFACTHSYSIPWILFTLFLLSGLSLPISEDLLVIAGGVIASTCTHDQTVNLFLWIYAGSLLGAWETYWIGRLFGPKLYDIRYFRSIVTPHRIKTVHHYYEKFGVLAFMVVRFCPGGVRSVFFITAGLGQMPFYKFALRDAPAALIWISTLFAVSYYFGANYQVLVHYFKEYSHIVLGLIVVGLLGAGIYFVCKKK